MNLEGVASCVLPVWLAHCSWDDVQMLFAVNGETGKCVGDLPIDGKRRATTVCITAMVLLVVAVLFALIRASSGDHALYSELPLPLIIAAVVTILVDQYFVSQMKTAVEAGDADENRSSEGLVVTDRWSTELCGRKSQARKMLDEYMQERE